MKKKNILVAILVVIAISTFIVTAISGHEQATSEKNLSKVINSFLARDYVWDESREKICYPEYIEVSMTSDGAFFIMFPLETNYSMYYATSIGKPSSFFVETPYSIKGAAHTEFADIFSICKRLQYDTCFFTTDAGIVTIKKMRIYRDGTLDALDSKEEWHKNVSCNNFILS